MSPSLGIVLSGGKESESINVSKKISFICLLKKTVED